MVYKTALNNFDEGDLTTGTRICRICNIRQDINNFYWSGKVRVRKCKKCCGDRQRELKKNNKVERKEKDFNDNLRRKYGITRGQWDTLLKEQDNKCAICSNLINRETAQVDHNHTTNLIRGILCFNCNIGIGKFKDSIPLLYKTISYLEKESLDIKYRKKYLNKEERSRSRSEAAINFYKSKKGIDITKKRSINFSGENGSGVKLRDQDVFEIIEKYKNRGIQQWKLAEEYGVSQALISRIILGKSRKYIPTEIISVEEMKLKGIANFPKGENNPASTLTQKMVNIIRKEHLDGVNGSTLAKKYNIAKTTISKILNNKSWRIYD